MPKRQGGWAYSGRGKPSAKLPEGLKAELERKANQIVETVLKPKYVVPPPEDARWNYIADIYTRWHGSYFYFCARYNRPDPNAPEPHFESRFARMEYVGQNQFNLSFMRYTGQWVEIYQSLSVDECLESIQNDPFFQP